jgi:hypothetical protein
MKHRFAKVAASVAIAAGLVFAAPAMAQAYTPTGPDTVTITVTAPGPFPSPVPARRDRHVHARRRRRHRPQPRRRQVRRHLTTVTKTADSSGVATATVVGTPGGLLVDALRDRRARLVEAGGGALPSTGGDSESLPASGSAVALVLAGATVAVAATVRRNRQETNA